MKNFHNILTYRSKKGIIKQYVTSGIDIAYFNVMAMINSEKGFSLVELIVVLALIGIAAGIAFPTISRQMPKFRVNGTTRDIAAKLMLARLRAIQENSNYGVEFTLGPTDTYALVRQVAGVWNQLPAPASVSVATNEVNVVVQGCIANNRVEFSANGTVNAGACAQGAGDYVAMSWIIRITTLAGDLPRDIYVNPNTGHVKVD